MQHYKSGTDANYNRREKHLAFRDDGSQFQNDAAAVNAVEQTSTAGPSVLPAVVPSERKSTAVALPSQRSTPAVQGRLYAAGRIRREHDSQLSEYYEKRDQLTRADARFLFLDDLPHDVAHQYAATAMTEFEGGERAILRAEGIDLNWRSDESAFDDILTSDDL